MQFRKPGGDEGKSEISQWFEYSWYCPPQLLLVASWIGTHNKSTKGNSIVGMRPLLMLLIVQAALESA